MLNGEIDQDRDISGDVRLYAVFVEEGSAIGHSVCMRNVGVKRFHVHLNQHGCRSKCVYMTTKIAEKMSSIFEITGIFLSNGSKKETTKPEMCSVIVPMQEIIGR